MENEVDCYEGDVFLLLLVEVEVEVRVEAQLLMDCWLE